MLLRPNQQGVNVEGPQQRIPSGGVLNESHSRSRKPEHGRRWQRTIIIPARSCFSTLNLGAHPSQPVVPCYLRALRVSVVNSRTEIRPQRLRL